MKIAVCIKQVPTREWHPRLNEAKTWIRDQDASFEMNEPDAYALEEALRLKEKHGGEVVVCSAGPARVAQVIREALARGADRAIHVEDDALASADAFVTSDALAAAMRDDKFDLVLTGLQSDDQGFAQVGVILAEKLGLPHATIIMEVQIQRDGRRCRQTASQARAGRRMVPVGRNAAAGSADDSERDQSAPVRDAQRHYGGEEEGNPEGRGRGGAGAPKQKIVSLYLPEKGKKTQMISGSPAEAAKELVRRLRDDARVI